VLLKALPPGVSGLDRLVEFSRQFPTALANNGHLLVLVACALAVLLLVRREGTLARAHGGITALLWVFVGGTLLHLLLAKTGWFFRYEAYLVTVGLTVCAAALKLFPWPESKARRAAWVLLALVLATPLAFRAVLALGQTPGATRNIHEQQHQTALFLKQYYKGRAVGLNDIGFPSYLSEVRLLDLLGLASMDVAKLKRDGKYQREALRALATSHRLEIAAVYDEWFGESIPREWVRVAKWSVGSNVVLGSTEVSFYAVSPEQAAELKANLMSFSSQLPKGVAVKW
jgi:hypothetical protein